jgi:hypothetical protein
VRLHHSSHTTQRTYPYLLSHYAAILQKFKDELEELEDDTLGQFLMCLPAFDTKEV